MKNKFLLISVASLVACSARVSSENAQQPERAVFIFQDFSSSDFKGGIWEEFMNDTAVSFKGTITDKVKMGDKGNSFVIDYDFRTGTDLVGGLWLGVAEYDFSKYEYLGFWVKGEPDLGYSKIIGVTIEDKFGRGVTIMSSGVSDDWNNIEISLDVLKKGNLSDLFEINIFIDKRYTSIDIGRCYIDNFYLK
ncbi:MAG: hypothetical protein PHQ54_00720 [Candidatus Omnitrophica bacterium]|nr:hypothetical protein [Candidatus Omnitrophota bacterium]